MYTSKELQERLDERQKYVAIGDVDQGWALIGIALSAINTIREYETMYGIADGQPCSVCGAVPRIENGVEVIHHRTPKVKG